MSYTGKAGPAKSTPTSEPQPSDSNRSSVACAAATASGRRTSACPATRGTAPEAEFTRPADLRKDRRVERKVPVSALVTGAQQEGKVDLENVGMGITFLTLESFARLNSMCLSPSNIRMWKIMVRNASHWIACDPRGC